MQVNARSVPIDLEQQEEPKRKGASPETLMAKAGNIVAEALQKLRFEKAKTAADDERVLKILRTAFANKAVENVMKHHPSITDDDRSFLRDVKGWSV